MANGYGQGPDKNHCHRPKIYFSKIAVNGAAFFCHHGTHASDQCRSPAGDVQPKHDTEE